ncbi:MAG: helix-turn-helix domain-containing protein [Lachnospiraceae bacterium]
MGKRIAAKADILRLAASLRFLRQEREYTQQEIADAAGIERTTYTTYETARNIPNVFILARIAELYGISVDDILHNPDVAYLFRKE